MSQSNESRQRDWNMTGWLSEPCPGGGSQSNESRQRDWNISDAAEKELINTPLVAIKWIPATGLKRKHFKCSIVINVSSQSNESRQRDWNFLHLSLVAAIPYGRNQMNPGNGTETNFVMDNYYYHNNVAIKWIPATGLKLSSSILIRWSLGRSQSNESRQRDWNIARVRDPRRILECRNQMNPGNGTETIRINLLESRLSGRNQMNPGNGTETIKLWLKDSVAIKSQSNESRQRDWNLASVSTMIP